MEEHKLREVMMRYTTVYCTSLLLHGGGMEIFLAECIVSRAVVAVDGFIVLYLTIFSRF